MQKTGTYKLELGGEASLQAYEDVLSAVQFDTDGNGNLEPSTRSIQFQVTDTTALVSNVAQIDLAVAFEAEGLTINGGSGDDTLVGGAGDDFLDGKGGDDVIDGGSGDDFLLGGTGDDVLTSDGEEDILFGGAGNDTIEVEGDDYAHGGSGDDLFRVDTDDIADWKQGNSVGGNDAYDATAAAAANAADGNDIDLNDVTNDGIDGGSGHDTLQINASQDTTINLGEGDYEDMVDTINNIEAIDLTGGDGNITLGLDSDDVIKLTDDDNEWDIILGEGDEVDFGDGDQPVEGTNDDGSTNFTYFDNGGNILAKINIRDDTDNTGT